MQWPTTFTPSALPWMALYRNPSINGPNHPAFAQFHSAVQKSASNLVKKQTIINKSGTPMSSLNLTPHPSHPRCLKTYVLTGMKNSRSENGDF